MYVLDLSLCKCLETLIEVGNAGQISIFYDRLECSFMSAFFLWLQTFFRLLYQVWNLDNRNCRTDTKILDRNWEITYTCCIYSFFRIGSIILALHDASDVFMEAAKVFKYSGREFGASVCFGFFAVSWLILRLIFFPFWVIKATRFVFFILIIFMWLCFGRRLLLILFLFPLSSIDLQQCLNLSEGYDMFLYYIFNTMLIMLLIFHIYWWKLICAMIYRQLKNRGKVGEDIRSGKQISNTDWGYY